MTQVKAKPKAAPAPKAKSTIVKINPDKKCSVQKKHTQASWKQMQTAIKKGATLEEMSAKDGPITDPRFARYALKSKWVVAV